MDERFDPEKTVDMQWLNLEGRNRWLVDNETGERVLIDTQTGKIVGRWKRSEVCPLCGK